MAQDFAVISQVAFKRHVFSICAASANQFVVGEQGGYLAMVHVSDVGTLTLQVETKVTDAIFKVIKISTTTASSQESEFALACSGGLFFARYDQSKP